MDESAALPALAVRHDGATYAFGAQWITFSAAVRKGEVKRTIAATPHSHGVVHRYMHSRQHGLFDLPGERRAVHAAAMLFAAAAPGDAAGLFMVNHQSWLIAIHDGLIIQDRLFAPNPDVSEDTQEAVAAFKKLLREHTFTLIHTDLADIPNAQRPDLLAILSPRRSARAHPRGRTHRLAAVAAMATLLALSGAVYLIHGRPAPPELIAPLQRALQPIILYPSYTEQAALMGACLTAIEHLLGTTPPPWRLAKALCAGGEGATAWFFNQDLRGIPRLMAAFPAARLELSGDAAVLTIPWPENLATQEIRDAGPLHLALAPLHELAGRLDADLIIRASADNNNKTVGGAFLNHRYQLTTNRAPGAWRGPLAAVPASGITALIFDPATLNWTIKGAFHARRDN